MLRNNTSSRISLQFLLLVTLMILAFPSAPATALDLSTDNPPLVTPSISQGDSVFIHGTATGHPYNGLQVWLIGNNYARVQTVAVNNDNSYEYELTPSETRQLASGQYFVLIQHPMMNGEFDIIYNAGTGEVINLQLVNTATGTGTAIFRLTGPGSLQGPAAASSLVRAVGSQNIDDSFTTVSFFIEPPNALIDPIVGRVAGDRFTIGGSTNLAPGNNLLVEVYSASFKPTQKGQPGEFSGTSAMVKVQKGSGRYNRWSLDVDTSAWKPDEYIITVSAVIQDVRESTTFTLDEQRTPVSVGTSTAPMVSTSPAASRTTGPIPALTTRKTSPATCTILFGLVFSLALYNARRKL